MFIISGAGKVALPKFSSTFTLVNSVRLLYSETMADIRMLSPKVGKIVLLYT